MAKDTNKQGFHFAASGERCAQYIEAETLEDATRIFLDGKAIISLPLPHTLKDNRKHKIVLSGELSTPLKEAGKSDVQ